MEAKHYIRGLTGLRGFAAVWVYLHHSWSFSGPRKIAVDLGGFSLDLTAWFSIGWAGVDIFYVLSGFLLCLPFSEHAHGFAGPVALRYYFLRRLLRVLPAYYAQIAILLLLASLQLYPYAIHWGDVLLHALMLHNWDPVFNSSINGVYWTLPVEFGFYLLLPLLAWWLPGRRWIALLVLALVLTIGYRLLVFQSLAGQGIEYKVWRLEQFPGHLDQFVIGMLAAHWYVSLTHSRFELAGQTVFDPRWSNLLFVAGWVGIGLLIQFFLKGRHLAYWNGHPMLFVWHGLVAICIAMSILGTALGSPLARLLLNNRLAVFVGVISYSLYLWHLPILNWVKQTAWFQGYQGYVFPAYFLLTLPMVLLLSWISYFLVERPFLRLRRHWPS